MKRDDTGMRAFPKKILWNDDGTLLATRGLFVKSTASVATAAIELPPQSRSQMEFGNETQIRLPSWRVVYSTDSSVTWIRRNNCYGINLIVCAPIVVENGPRRLDDAANLLASACVAPSISRTALPDAAIRFLDWCATP